MPNWCNTAYTVTGDTQEVKALYELMKGLEEQEKPAVDNGFGTTWLGCLVNALGEDWNNIRCRGHWEGLEFDGEVLTFWTETAWSVCNEVFELARQKFPSLSYYYRAEEPGMCDYYTNDADGIYYPERYVVDACSDKCDWYTEYFTTLQDAYAWLEQVSGVPVHSEDDVRALEKQWRENDPDGYAYISIHELKVYRD